MPIVAEQQRLGQNGPDDYPRAVSVGPIGRLGRYTATHFRVVLVGWIVTAVVLGFFAPKVETALSGAGWETTGSQSAQARNLISKNFHGLSSYALMTVVYSPTKAVSDPAFQRAIANMEARSSTTARSRASCRLHRGSRSPRTGTPRSCRPARPAVRTRWSRPR
jgi:hypothetical protein